MKYSDEEIKLHRQLWIDALRSGEYPQGKGYLNRDGKFCCLGVACEVFIKNGGTLDKQMSDLDEDAIIYDDSTGILPISVAEWLNMTRGGYYKENKIVRNLVSLNDIIESSFDSIANIIETADLIPYDEHYEC